jgi:hypothetical protein
MPPYSSVEVQRRCGRIARLLLQGLRESRASNKLQHTVKFYGTSRRHIDTAVRISYPTLNSLFAWLFLIHCSAPWRWECWPISWLPTHPLPRCSHYEVLLSTGIKRPGREADHSQPSVSRTRIHETLLGSPLGTSAFNLTLVIDCEKLEDHRQAIWSNSLHHDGSG